VFPVDGERPGGAAAGPGLRRGAGEQRADLEMMHQFTGEARRGSLAGFGACSPEARLRALDPVNVRSIHHKPACHLNRRASDQCPHNFAVGFPVCTPLTDVIRRYRGPARPGRSDGHVDAGSGTVHVCEDKARLSEPISLRSPHG